MSKPGAVYLVRALFRGKLRHDVLNDGLTCFTEEILADAGVTHEPETLSPRMVPLPESPLSTYSPLPPSLSASLPFLRGRITVH